MAETAHPKASPPRERIIALIERERAAFARSHRKSRDLYERAGDSLFGGVPMSWMMKWAGGFPVFAERAEGSTVFDVDGNEYADFCLGDTGAMTGHAPQAVAATAAEQAARAITTMMPSPDAPVVGALLHLYALNRGVLITPFHNMAPIAPTTTEAQVDRHTAVFSEALEELYQ